MLMLYNQQKMMRLDQIPGGKWELARMLLFPSLSLSLYFPDISSRQTKASKGMIPTTFSETYCKEKNLNSKQNTMAWQVTHGPG